MRQVISISVGEIVLKGKNRKNFENALINKIKRALKNLEIESVYKEIGKIFIEVKNHQDIDEAISIVKNVFGIVYISKCFRVDKDLKKAEEAIRAAIADQKIKDDFSFKIIASRADKNFPLTSPEINRHFGGFVLKNYPGAKVDVHEPEYPIYVDIRQYIYVYIGRQKGLGGMPMGTNGKGLVLLSGGIDSPVAAFMMARRGIGINAIHFHTYPYTSERSEKKVLDLAEIVSRYTGPMKVYSVNILEINRTIAQNCYENNMTILSRRMMMRIAERISKINDYDGLITGDNLGQVASQTIKSLKVIDRATDMLVFRPLISFDKQQIIDISEEIGALETSNLPFDDCCTIFAPKHPNLNPKLDQILKEEEKYDIEGLIERALETIKITKID
ncbi:MAG: tRNA uracil 4-sulfurtransferase ThiI [Bacillota bacterium]|nr:tRNA uracil 4-sulfurtransferase ThiI [Bacillota bacterium]